MRVYTVPVPETKMNQSTRETIGEAIYLLGYLIGRVNWETGRAVVTHERITADTGFPERTLCRWFQTLCDAGEITTRRTRRGTLVEIVDYKPIARTRGVHLRAEARTPGAAHDADSDTPPAAGREAARGACEMPPAADEDAGSGVSNTKRILSPSNVQSFVQAPLSSCDDEGSPSLRPGDEADGSEEVGLREAQRAVQAMAPEEYEALMQRAMLELESDPQPFKRIFVRRSPLGELEPDPRYGQMMIVRRMAEIAAGGGCHSHPMVECGQFEEQGAEAAQ